MKKIKCKKVFIACYHSCKKIYNKKGIGAHLCKRNRKEKAETNETGYLQGALGTVWEEWGVGRDNFLNRLFFTGVTLTTVIMCDTAPKVNT